LWIAGPARAQFNVSVAVDSDDRFRGLSLSDGRPVLSASVGFDQAGGVYLGASVADQPGARLTGYGQYLGYAQRLNTDIAWDVGVNNQYLTDYAGKNSYIHYSEIYSGLSIGQFSSHIYFSPDYFKPDAKTIYVDINGAIRPAGGWRLFAHAGALTPLQSGGAEHYDLSAGVARQFKAFELHVSWSGASPAQPQSTTRNRSGLELGAAYFF